MVNYYPTNIRIYDINKAFPELALEDEDEMQRILDMEALRERGKGAPKKAKRKEDSRRLAKKR